MCYHDFWVCHIANDQKNSWQLSPLLKSPVSYILWHAFFLFLWTPWNIYLKPTEQTYIYKVLRHVCTSTCNLGWVDYSNESCTTGNKCSLNVGVTSTEVIEVSMWQNPKLAQYGLVYFSGACHWWHVIMWAIFRCTIICGQRCSSLLHTITVQVLRWEVYSFLQSFPV